MDLNNPKYSGLYTNDVHYWLASADNPDHLWNVYSSAYVSNYFSSREYGVRPVVSLKSNVKTSAMDTQGRWIIEIEGRNRMGEMRRIRINEKLKWKK